MWANILLNKPNLFDTCDTSYSVGSIILIINHTLEPSDDIMHVIAIAMIARTIPSFTGVAMWFFTEINVSESYLA